MKKIFAIALCLALALSLAACGPKAPAVEPTENATDATDAAPAVKTMADGVLTVGMEIGYPPFEYYADDGVTPQGIDVDMATAIADKLGMEVNFIDTAWDTIFAGIGMNYDCVMSAVTISDDRKENMDFSTPYIKNYQTVVVKTDSEIVVNGFEDLDGLSVSVQAETTSDIKLKELLDTNSIKATRKGNEKVITCFTELENGEVDAVLCDSSVATSYIAKAPDTYKIAWSQETDAEEFGVAMAKGDTQLQTAINAAIAELEAEGVIEEILTKWLG